MFSYIHIHVKDTCPCVLTASDTVPVSLNIELPKESTSHVCTFYMHQEEEAQRGQILHEN